MGEWKEYGYSAESQYLNNGTIQSLRPVLEVELATPAKNIFITALVDSGTDSTLVHSSVADALYISRSTCRPVRMGGAGPTVGGVSDQVGFACELNVKFEGFEEEFRIPIVFADHLPFQALLGQKGFFEHFDVKFSKSRNIFKLKRV